MTPASPYRFKPDRFSSHAQIAADLRRRARSLNRPYTVLDVGCASGFLRAFLPSPEFRLIGLEYDPALAEQAGQKYDQVYQVDLAADFNIPLKEMPDAIVLADVLEHLPYPDSSLRRLLREYAKPGTPIIISLPNVAHLYVRLSLLFGQFNYSDRGILDRTHLRFYTLKTARQLCIENGIHLQALNVTPVPLPLVHPLFGEGNLLFPIHVVSAWFASVLKGLLAFQFIFSGVYEPY